MKNSAMSNQLNQDEVAKLVHIYQSRNRLAHHEPVLHKRFHDTISAIRFIACRLEEKRSHAHSALAKIMEEDLLMVEAAASALHEKLDQYRIPSR